MPKAAAAVLLGLMAGLRVMEMQSMTWGDIWEGKPLILRVRLGKRKKARSIRIPLPLVNALHLYRAWAKAAGFPTGKDDGLFLKMRKGHFSPLTRRGVQKAVQRFLSLCKVRGHSVHHLRHTYASALYVSSDKDLSLVQSQLGHDDVTTTMIYIQTISEEIEHALRNLYR